ncbi:MAG: hypothetical protein NXI22_09685 [bacterium]|nr:hypothetical protein [bacterium]
MTVEMPTPNSQITDDSHERKMERLNEIKDWQLANAKKINNLKKVLSVMHVDCVTILASNLPCESAPHSITIYRMVACLPIDVRNLACSVENAVKNVHANLQSEH